MENIIYRICDTYSALAKNPHHLEFFCVQTNTLNPEYPIRELGIVVTSKRGLQIDFSLDAHDLKQLHKYLDDLIEYTEEFNKKSKQEALNKKQNDE